jgi:hypothetical protein
MPWRDLFQHETPPGLPEGVVDLDEYRRKREDEGTWPMDPEELHEWWKEMARKMRAQYGPVTGGESA